MSEEKKQETCSGNCNGTECNSAECNSKSCANCSKKKFDRSQFLIEGNEFSHIKKIIGIVSGKGGVGKSTVTCLLARKLSEKGYRVGVLDADITGPSIPRMMGIYEPVASDERGIIPPVSEDGIPVISMNLLLENEDDAVIYRGPIIAGLVKQFYSDVFWGELDYLLVDMPPGTGDVPLTVFQSLPVDGIVIVTSPQSLVSMIVKKAINMAAKMDVPVLGIVENYSFFRCPDCGRKEFIFGESHIDELAEEYNVPVIAKLPVDPYIASCADNGVYFSSGEPFDLTNIAGGLYDLAIFDLDGTLTDPKIGICTSVSYALKDIGIDEPDIDNLVDFIGPPLKEHFMERFKLDDATGDRCVEKYRERYSPVGIFECYLYDGIEELLATLKSRGVKIALATSKPEVMAVRLLEHFNIIKYFDAIAGSELDGRRTRKSEVIEHAFAKLKEKNIEFKNPIMIGDRMHDIIGAREAKITSLGVAYGYGSTIELRNAGADYIVEKVSDIAELI